MATLRRQVKNMVKNYSDAEVKVREATSNDPWGPSSTLMSEISDMTYNIVALGEIMRMIWKRLNDHGKNWRHVYKSLVLLDYLIKNGNEKVAQQCKEHIVAIQTLKDFQFMDEQKDQGANVREKAKQLVNLLRDDERLKEERAKAFRARERYAQNAMGISSDNKIVFATGMPKTASKPNASYADPYGGAGASSAPKVNSELEAVRPSDPNEEDLQLKLALMLSQQEHEEELQRKRADDAKLQLALEQSKVEGQPNGLIEIGDSDLNDPWGGSKSNQSNVINSKSTSNQFFSSKNDPWTASNSVPSANGFSNNINNNASDPWGAGAQPTSLNHSPSTNPWFESASSPSKHKSDDPWTSGAKKDDFDLFSSNRLGGASSTTNNNIQSNNDPFGDIFPSNSTSSSSNPNSINPWDSGNAESSHAFDPFSSNSNGTSSINKNNANSQKPPQIPSSLSSTAIRKTPESFLGENSSLVNLDNLIPARPKSTNPFGSAINNSNSTFGTSGQLKSSTSIGQLHNNPFAAQQQSQKGPSINQLANNNQFSLFQSPSNPNPPSFLPPSNSIGQLAQPHSIPPMAGTTAPTNMMQYGSAVPAFPSLQPLLPAAFNNTNNANQNNNINLSNANNNNNTNPFLMM